MRPDRLFLRLALFVSVVLALPFAAVRGQEASQSAPFELRDGDRVLFLGDALLEREITYGHIELRMHEQFPKTNFTVRNLSWSGETPRGWSRASFDSPEKGFQRLKEEIALVKPTVAVLGFGMAASLQEITDRSKDILLNADPARYGREPMSAGRFKKELGELMDAIIAIGKTANPPAEVRFVLVPPIQHEDFRRTRPGMPDPAEHNKLLRQYTAAIEELARERRAVFANVAEGLKTVADKLTHNGITVTEQGLERWSMSFKQALRWGDAAKVSPHATPAWRAAVHSAVLRKNGLWFHRTRPANSTYLFGFRKHEQGRNAKEIPEFDALVAKADEEIFRLKQGGQPAAPAPTPTVADAQKQAELPQPKFDLAEGLEISLWAANPEVEKPVAMNWDGEGRLWVASTPIYPQIEPGKHAQDKVFILEDKDGDGRAETSTIFADDLLIPTGVAPDLIQPADPKQQPPLAAYVGASTELLHLVDTDGDGRADQRRIVFSGFGTEDTHHTIHTLRWGPDGRLYFNQSIYIHSHLETPWGMVRLNSGGTFAYDPRTERVEVIFKGFINPWGLAWDRWGQAFLTDGAGFEGVHWGVPGAMYRTYEGARQILPSISPGSYPKYAGLELISSPHFPTEWQGDVITCDFRAHRIVRFKINDLGEGNEPLSGYITKDMPDVVRTGDVAFRPIDVKLGPDGALYIADWTNPVINHGEVDFRDPRRDKVHGRIWRVSVKGKEPVKWEKMTAARSKEDSKSQNAWTQEQARRTAYATGALLSTDAAKQEDQAAEARIKDAKPRQRVLGMRSLARRQTLNAVNAVLEAAINAPGGAGEVKEAKGTNQFNQPTFSGAKDPFYSYAAWLSINDLAEVWTEAIAKGEWVPDSPEKERQLAWGLGAIRPEMARATLSKLVASGKVPLDGKGSWIELLGQAGGPGELRALAGALGADAQTAERILRALADAARLRNTRPDGDLGALAKDLLGRAATASKELRADIYRVLGAWMFGPAVPELVAAAKSPDAPVSLAAFEALRSIGGQGVSKEMEALVAAQNPAHVRREAAITLASIAPAQSTGPALAVLAGLTNEQEQLDSWRALLAQKGFADAVTAAISTNTNVSPAVAKSGLRAAREMGKRGEKLVAALTPLAGADAGMKKPADYSTLVEQTKKQGDPAAGELVYRRVQLACVVCHAIGGAGGKVGPELTSMGASAPLDYIIESVIDPAAKVKEGFHAVNLTLKDGKQVMGIQSRETNEQVFLRDATGGEQAVVKGEIAGRETIGSIMPAGLVDSLSEQERLNLYAFLGQLGKPGPFDASKATVARAWTLYPQSAADALAKGERPAGGMPAFTMVDGRLLKELIELVLPVVSNGEQPFLAVARFQTTTPGKVRLKFEGVTKVTLNGEALPAASEPEFTRELAAGVHTLVVKLDPKGFPKAVRVESPDARFLTD